MGLSVTQKPGDVVKIGPKITVTIREIRRGVVKLSIDAPKEVDIQRTGIKNPNPKEKT
jgi:carbon storage regulator CsrA